MKQLLASLTLCGLSLAVQGQKDAARYRERSEEVRQEIWGKAVAEFKVTSVPAEMNNESAVIIARGFDITNSSKSKLKWSVLSFGVARRNLYRTVYHERVKINDKTALNDFSTIEYRKKLDNSTRFGFSKIYNKLDTYIGAKIIKGDGKEVVVNTDEEVLTTDEKKKQEGKLAISDLQVGDILDYYIDVEEMQETGEDVQGPFTFVMGGEYPILYLNVRMQLDEKAGVKYIAANNAPDLRRGVTDDGEIVLKLEMKNLPKFQSNMWTSPYRQIPYIILQYKIVCRGESPMSGYTAGTVIKGQMADKLTEAFRQAIPQLRLGLNYKPLEMTYEHFGGRKKLKNVPQDSVVKVLYDKWRYYNYCRFNTEKIDVGNDIKFERVNSLQGVLGMSNYLQDLNIDHDILLVCSRNEQSMQNVMNMGDMDALIKMTIDGKTYYIAYDDFTTRFNEIPVRFQGEQCKAIQAVKGRHGFEFTYGTWKLPVTEARENGITETIQAKLSPAAMQQLQVDRTCSLFGSFRNGEQKRLLLAEDIDGALSQYVGMKPYTQRLGEDKRLAKLVPEFASAFSKEKSDWKKYFKSEIKEQYEEEPKEVTAFEIKDDGLLHSSPAFVYRSAFTMDNFVKKAGNNYIVDAGKLIGKFNKLEDKERTRVLDVYMYSARTFTFNINIAIPEGYTAKGVEEMATNMTNDAGSFVSTAVVDGSNIKISVTRSFKNAFEPAANWPKLVSLLDGAYEFYNKKILLEKKK
jgi:hypothetical protein